MSTDGEQRTVWVEMGARTWTAPVDHATGAWTVTVPMPAERPRARRRGISGPLWSWLAYRVLRWLMLACGGAGAWSERVVRRWQWRLERGCVRIRRCPECGGPLWGKPSPQQACRTDDCYWNMPW